MERSKITLLHTLFCLCWWAFCSHMSSFASPDYTTCTTLYIFLHIQTFYSIRGHSLATAELWKMTPPPPPGLSTGMRRGKITVVVAVDVLAPKSVSYINRYKKKTIKKNIYNFLCLEKRWPHQETEITVVSMSNTRLASVPCRTRTEATQTYMAIFRIGKVYA